MRIAVIVRSLKIGGMERVAINLSESFAEAGHESHLIYFKDKGRVFTPNKSVHFHHFNLDKILRLTIIGAVLGVFAKLFSAIFRGSFFIYNGILLAPIFNYKLQKLEKEYGRFDLIIMRGHGTFELIWPYRDDRVVQMIESVFIRNGSWLDRLYLNCVYSGKNLAGVSNGVKEKINEVLKENQIEAKSVNVVHNSIDVNLINQRAKDYKPQIDEKYILSLGRVTPNKNLSFLLKSYKYARDNMSLDLPLVIVGDGHDMNNIKDKIKKLELDSYIRLEGLVENPYPWILNASLLTSTSKAEGFGMVLLEALATHTNIISTKSKGGVTDIMVGELENYLVDFSVEKFAKKMVNILKEEKVYNFELYTKEFLPSTIVKKYISLYI